MSDSAQRVLIVEDDESFRRILSRHLRSQGYEVDEAASVEAGTKALEQHPRPGTVVLDLSLPGRLGWDLLGEPAFAAAGSPPVVIISATTVSPTRLAEFSCAAYLAKPFALETLVTTLERVLHPNAHGAIGYPRSRSEPRTAGSNGMEAARRRDR